MLDIANKKKLEERRNQEKDVRERMCDSKRQARIDRIVWNQSHEFNHM